MEVVRLPRRPAGRGGQQRCAVPPKRPQQRRQGAAAGGVQRQQRAGRGAAPLEEVLQKVTGRMKCSWTQGRPCEHSMQIGHL